VSHCKYASGSQAKPSSTSPARGVSLLSVGNGSSRSLLLLVRLMNGTKMTTKISIDRGFHASNSGDAASVLLKNQLH